MLLTVFLDKMLYNNDFIRIRQGRGAAGLSGDNMAICDTCAYFAYDEDYEEYYCEVDLDEDDLARYYESDARECPFYRNDDEYAVVRHQI